MSAPATTEVLLVRHCESVGSAPDADVTDRGRVQAAELATLLAVQPIAALVTSPYRRAHAASS